MKWWPAECRPGDMVRVKLGTIYHYGVCEGDGSIIQFGYPPIPAYADKNDPPVVCRVENEVFCCGQIPEVAVLDKKELKKRIPPDKTVSLARSRLGEGGYDLIRNNCEHFAYECVLGIKYSEQEQAARKKWLDRGMLDVYIAPIPEGELTGDVGNALRKKYIDLAENNELKKQRYHAWALLENALERSAHISADGAVRDENGAWHIPGGGVYFSLSHTKTAVAVAVSDRRVGIDVEPEDAFDRYDKGELFDMAWKIVSKKETLPKSSSELLLLWCKKEAVFKSLGEASFVPDKINTGKYTVEAYTATGMPGHVFAVCGQTRCMNVYCGIPPRPSGFTVKGNEN